MGLRDDWSWWLPEAGPVELADLTVAGLLAAAAADSGDRDAVIVSAYPDLSLNVRWTYRDLHDRARHLARALIGAGVATGDRVALWAPNVPDWLVTEFAVAMAGAVLVPVNPTYRRDELRHVLADSGATACLFLPAFARLDLWPELAAIGADLPALRLIVSLGDPVGDVPGLAGFLAGATPVGEADLDRRTAAVRTGDVAQIQYTSGTTGRPKGATLTHHGIVNNARQSAALWRIGPDDRWCNPLPLFHTAGCAMLALGAVAARAAHLPLVRFDAGKVLTTIETERCTVLEVVPTILTALTEAQRGRGADLTSLRLVGTSGAPTPGRLGRICRDEWGVPLRVLYGSTEVSPTVSGTGLDEPGDLGWTTVGRVLPWAEARITDPATGEVVPVGQRGELQVRGYLVMREYHGRPEASAEAISPDGWFRTGDLATIDAGGYLRIVGRLKDVIIRGGENIYPAEIEDLIRGYPGVRDAAVIGVPDPFFGEEACAVVSALDGAEIDGEALRGWLAVRVSHQKVPRYVLALPHLPQTASGKIQKYLLREQVGPALAGPVLAEPVLADPARQDRPGAGT